MNTSCMWIIGIGMTVLTILLYIVFRAVYRNTFRLYKGYTAMKKRYLENHPHVRFDKFSRYHIGYEQDFLLRNYVPQTLEYGSIEINDADRVDAFYEWKQPETDYEKMFLADYGKGLVNFCIEKLIKIVLPAGMIAVLCFILAMNI